MIAQQPRSFPAAEREWLGVFLRGYTPSPQDYRAYEDRRKAIFRRLHVAVALSMGGIIWRLAVEDMGLEIEWPGVSYGRAYRIRFDCPEYLLIGDCLTSDEIRIICGVHLIPQGK